MAGRKNPLIANDKAVTDLVYFHINHVSAGIFIVWDHLAVVCLIHESVPVAYELFHRDQESLLTCNPSSSVKRYAVRTFETSVIMWPLSRWSLCLLHWFCDRTEISVRIPYHSESIGRTQWDQWNWQVNEACRLNSDLVTSLYSGTNWNEGCRLRLETDYFTR